MNDKRKTKPVVEEPIEPVLPPWENICATCNKKLPCKMTGVRSPGAWQKGFPCGKEPK